MYLFVRPPGANFYDMATYSADLRPAPLRACERRLGAQRALADLFGVSVSCAEQWLRRSRTTGTAAPKPHAGGQRPRLEATAHGLVRQRVHDQPAATLGEGCAGLATPTATLLSVSTRGRALQRLGLPRLNSRFTPRHATPRA